MLSVLVLCDLRNAAQQRVAILDHVRFLDHAEPGRVAVTYVNMAEVTAVDPRWLEHDVIVLHTTLLCWRWYPQFAVLAKRLEWMQQFTGLVAAMPQDEYDHAHTLDEWLVSLRVQVIVTCFDDTHRALLYPRMHQRAFFVEALTGYLHPARVVSAREQRKPIGARGTDVVYRANHLPYWFGWLGNIKARLGLEGTSRLSSTGLRLDISVRPEDTVLGDQWLDFLASSRSILGSESGSSVLDKRGEVALHVRSLLADQPNLSFTDADALCGGELTRYHFAALGPRHLEAIMMGTVQVLVEGHYSGLFRPWEHYIPVKRDLSDLPAIADALRDDALVTRIAERALADFVVSGEYGYDRLANHFLNVMELFGSVQASAQSA
ncbi:MAG: hypothetical protein IPP90_22725 [Gemmatimonadaceae bacterium]|nr:hypothetical protein [Gemmatimonadaceae bacterium]